MKIKVFFLTTLLSLRFLSAQSIEESLVTSLNHFANQSYYIIQSSEKSLIYSPFSLVTTLLMTSLGTVGMTNESIQNLLSLQIPEKDAILSYSSLLSKIISNDDQGYAFQSINALWIANSFPIKPSYKQEIQKIFNGQAFSIDFTNTYQTMNTINKWAKRKTNDHIPALVSLGDLDPLNKILITNACYFQGNWEYPFNKKLTKRENFYFNINSPSSAKEVPMMHQTIKTKYTESDSFQILALPFQRNEALENRISCLIFLPKEGANLSLVDYFQVFFQEMSYDTLFESLSDKFVEVKIPKFQMQTKIYLNDILSSLGGNIIFSPKADFSKISDVKGLQVSTIFQSSFFSFDEKGVVATAATAAAIGLTSTLEKPEIKFIANRPFAFYLIDMDTKLILFMGVYADQK